MEFVVIIEHDFDNEHFNKETLANNIMCIERKLWKGKVAYRLTGNISNVLYFCQSLLVQNIDHLVI